MKKKIITTIFCFISGLLLGLALFALQFPSKLSVTFFDVGQGDSALVRSPSLKYVLIDTGSNSAHVEKKIAALLPFGRHMLDFLVLTHPDSDHIGRAEHVVREYEVGGLAMPRSFKDLPTFSSLLATLQEKEVPVLFLKRGDRVNVAHDFFFNVIWPPEGGGEIFSSNNNSLVLELHYHDDSILFTGDTEAPSERILSRLKAALFADILKVGHHGSKSSSSMEFLERVRPKISIVSVGENSYGHPNPGVLERLQSSLILRTDAAGDITLVSDGDTW